MKKKNRNFVIGICVVIAMSTSVYALESATSTATIGSLDLGFNPSNATLALFTQDGSGTVIDGSPSTNNYFPINNPGSFTSDPFGCVFTTADFGSGAGGCGHIEANDPVTAPSGSSGAGHDATGIISSDISMNLFDTGKGGDFSVLGEVNFSLCMKCDSDPTIGVVTLSQYVEQDIDFGTSGNDSHVVIDNRKNGSDPITFKACADSTYEICDKTLKMEIPWALTIDQNILEAPGGSFQTASSGIFTYEVQPNDDTIHEAYIFDAAPCVWLGAGYTGSCFPAPGTFSLPGFDMSHQSPMLGNGSNNFPAIW